MNNLTCVDAQADMRKAYLCGAPGVLVSGGVWLLAAAVALFASGRLAVWTLLIGGMFIFPLSLVLTRLLGHSGRHAPDNALGRLAGEGTFALVACIAVAFGLSLVRVEWFFAAMLLFIGGRYLTFQTLYGLRLYWLLGAVLCAAGLGVGLGRPPAAVGACAGAVIELLFAWRLFAAARKAVPGNADTVRGLSK